MGRRTDDPDGSGSCGKPRFPRCLCLHQGTRRTQPRRDPRRGTGRHRAALHHRIGARRTGAGLDSRLPYGRAGHRRLRPRPSQRVPRGARGCHRRHPRRPRGCVDPRHRRSRSAHQRGIRRARARHHPDRIGIGKPLQVRPDGRPRAGLLHQKPGLRRKEPAHLGARLDLPRPWPGDSAAQPGQVRTHHRRAHPRRVAPAGETGRDRRRPRTAKRATRSGRRLCRALRRLHRMRGDLPARPHVRLVEQPRRGGSARLQHGSPVDRLAPLRPRHPVALDGQDGPPQDAAEQGAVGRPQRADP